MSASAIPDSVGRGVPPSRAPTPSQQSRARKQASPRLERLSYLLHHVWRDNPFYRCKWRCAGLAPREIASFEALAHFPFTTRAELVADQTKYPPLGTNLTCSAAHIKYVHRSSGTTHVPLFWGDTPQSWDWVTLASQALFELAGVTQTDRVLILLSFSASSGPWIIRAGARRLGCCTFTADPNDPNLPDVIQRLCPTIVVLKPGRVFDVPKIIVTSSNRSIQGSVNHFFSRYGLTEAGSVAGECCAHTGMHLLEENFIAEVIDPMTTEPIPDGASGELVLTTLGRIAQPIIRYRTGDIVRLLRTHTCPCGRTEALLVGGVQRHPKAMGKWQRES